MAANYTHLEREINGPAAADVSRSSGRPDDAAFVAFIYEPSSKLIDHAERRARERPLERRHGRRLRADGDYTLLNLQVQYRGSDLWEIAVGGTNLHRREFRARAGLSGARPQRLRAAASELLSGNCGAYSRAGTSRSGRVPVYPIPGLRRCAGIVSACHGSHLVHETAAHPAKVRMGDIGSAFAEAARLIAAADGTLFGIVLLSLEVSLTAVAAATRDRAAARRSAGDPAVSRTASAARDPERPDGLSARGRRAARLPVAVPSGSARRARAFVHASGNGHRSERYW